MNNHNKYEHRHYPVPNTLSEIVMFTKLFIIDIHCLGRFDSPIGIEILLKFVDLIVQVCVSSVEVVIRLGTYPQT